MAEISGIRQAINDSGLKKIENIEKNVASTLEGLKEGEELSQTALLQLQQKINSQTNTLSMMSTILKSLADSDKEVIRNC